MSARTFLKRRSDSRKQPRPSCLGRKAFRPGLEGLEDRLAPSCGGALLISGQLWIACDGANDHVIVDYPEILTTTVWANGISASWPTTAISNILIESGGGNDGVEIGGVRRPTTISLGDGNDGGHIGGIQGNPTRQGDLTRIESPVTVNSGPGTDALAVSDHSNPANGLTYEIHNNLVVRRGIGPDRVITYNGMNSGLNVRGGTGNNLFAVFSTHPWSTALYGGGGVTTTNILANSGAVWLDGQGGLDNVNIGNAGSLVNISEINVTNPPTGGYTAVTINNWADGVSRTVSVSDTAVSLGTSLIRYTGADLRSLSLNGGSGNNTYNVLNTPNSGFAGGVATNLNLRGGVDTVNVRGTRGPLFIEGGGALDNVTVGNAGSLVGILAAVNVRNSPSGGYTALSVDTSAFGGAYSATISDIAITFGGVPINYVQSDLRSLTLRGGSGTNTFTVTNTPNSGFAGGVTTTLLGGAAADTMLVRANRGPLVINGGGGLDNVNIGSAGSLAGILAAVSVSNPPAGGYTALTIDTSAFASSYTATVSDTAVSFGGVPINYAPGDLRSLTVLGGSGTNTYNIANTPASGFAGGVVTTIRGGSGVDTMNVLRTSGRLVINGNGGLDNVNVGNAGSLAQILAAVSVSNTPAGGYTALTIDNSASAGNYTATVSNTAVSFGIVPINYVPGDLRSLTVRGGNGSNTYTISNTPASGFPGGLVTTLFAGSGDDLIYLMGNAASTTAVLNGGAGNDSFVFGEGNLNGIAGTVSINGQAGSNTGRVNDGASTDGRNYIWNGSTLYWDGSGLVGGLTPVNMVWIDVYGGFADDTFYVLATGSVLLGTVGLAGTDTLFGPDAGGALALTNLNLGTLNGAGFALIENLIGGAGTDTFAFANGGSVSGYILGGGGMNFLDYSAYSANVYVSLPFWTATGVGAFIYQFQNATGGSGNDILVGDELTNLLIGGAGRDLLIGGGMNWTTGEFTFQPDALLGGDGEDILIGGITLYDYDPAALAAIRTEWTRATPYAQRVNNLTTGNGVPRLDATTVYSNYAGNYLEGGAGLDLFYGYPGWDLTDRDAAETFVPLG